MILFISIKKQTLIYVYAILLAVSALVLCYAIKEAKEDIRPSVPTAASGIGGKTILIDPGHGGFDAGASANGIDEKNINLSVAMKLKGFIEEGGSTVFMTRSDDSSTADENRSDGSSAKASDLRRRRNMVSECGADAFVSIHMNKFPQTEYWGAQVFYAANSEESKALGELIQSELPKTMNDGNTRAAKKSDGSIFILKNASVPSVIVECGFLSNADEAEKLKSDDYQSKIAWAVYMGICDYFNDTAEQ